MRYTPPVNIIRPSESRDKSEATQQISNLVENLYQVPRNPISDTTNFIVTSTSIDTQKISDIRFRDRNELLILAIDKFSALSNLNDADQTLTTLIWQDMMFAMKFGYVKRAERKALELLRVYNESRGRGGRFSEQLITTREELIARHRTEENEQKRQGLRNIFRKQQPPQQGQPMMQEEMRP